jgi:Ca2+-binding RTX toxin-like protein
MRTHNRIRSSRSRSVGFERLESREVFTGATLGQDGTLSIVGDDQHNDVQVSYFRNEYDAYDAIVVAISSRVNDVDLQAADTTQSYFDAFGVLKIQFTGLTGNDRLTVLLPPWLSMSVEANGGTGDDVLIGSYGADILNGDEGNDLLVGGSGVDTIRGGDGDDELSGGYGDDKLRGEDGRDILNGNQGKDDLSGGDGADKLLGGSGDDRLSGGSADDHLHGDAGNDKLTGGSGNDWLFGGTGRDRISGSTGLDIIDGGSGNDSMNGGSGRDHLLGGSGSDDIFGGSDADLLEGEEGSDSLYGDLGNDDLRGGTGNDGLFGGVDNDKLSDDSGRNRFLVFGRDNDVISKLKNTDTKITFVSSARRKWTSSEIIKVDEGFAALHRLTGDTRILRYNGASLNLTREKSSESNKKALADNTGGAIRFFDSAFKTKSMPAGITAIHEIGHNWEDEHKNWKQWLVLSGWTQDKPSSKNKSKYKKSENGKWWYLKSAEFARDYGKTNPKEDFATAWESYFIHELDYYPDSSDGFNKLPGGKVKHLKKFFGSV